MTDQHTPTPWGIEVTSSGLWIGPMRADGQKVAEIVAAFEYGDEYNDTYSAKQLANARLIVNAVNEREGLEAQVVGLKQLSEAQSKITNGLLLKQTAPRQ